MLKNFIIITLMFLNISVISFSQTVQLAGDIASLKTNEVILSYKKDGQDISDTVAANNGRFYWSAAMPEPQKIIMKASNKYYLFFVEAGALSVKTHSNLPGVTVKGSPVNDAYNLMESTLRKIKEEEFRLQRQLKAANGIAQDGLMKQMENLNSKQISIERAYIINNPGSPISVNLVFEQSRTGTYETINALFLRLDTNARNSMMGKEITKSLELLKRSAIGEPIVNFMQSDTSGSLIRISDFKGRYVLIDFWASWCMPCRAEHPNVLKTYQRFKDKGFTILGISLDKESLRWKKAIVEDNLPWAQLSDLKGWKNEVAKYYGIYSIPSNLLLDREGRIIAENLRTEAMQRKLDELLD